MADEAKANKRTGKRGPLPARPAYFLWDGMTDDGSAHVNPRITRDNEEVLDAVQGGSNHLKVMIK